jgi:uncharacterized transporter YbjL
VAFRDHRVLGTVGYALVTLGILSFVVRVINKVATGHSLEPDVSGRLTPWTYGGALVTIVALVLVGVIGGLIWLINRYRQH